MTDSELYDRIYDSSPYVLGVLAKMTRSVELSEDILQDAIIRMIEKRHQFKGKTYGSFRAWFTTIAVNIFKNYARRKTNKPHMEFDEGYLGSYEWDAVEDLDSERVSDELSALIATLPPKQRKALILRVFRDMPFKDIANEMNCKYDTAKANYRHAIMSLRDRLDVPSFTEDSFWFDHQ